MVFSLVGADTIPESPLSIGINVHLDDTGCDGILDVFNRRPRSTVEDEEHGLVSLVLKLLGDVLLRVVKDYRLQVNVSRGVDTVNISERSSTSEGGIGDLGKLLVSIPNLFRLGVKTGRVDIGVVNTVLFSTSDTELEFEKDVNLGEFLHVFLADCDVLFEGLFGKIKHMGREEWCTGFLVVLLVGSKNSVHPGQPGFLTVVGVKDDRDSVKSSNFMNVLGGSNDSGEAGRVISVVCGLSGNELTSSLGESHHNGPLVLFSGLHTGIDGVGSDNIDSWDGETSFLRGIEKINKSLTSDNTRLDGSWQLFECLGFESKKKTGVRLSLPFPARSKKLQYNNYLGLGLGFGGHAERGSPSAESGARGEGDGRGGKKEGSGKLHG